MRVLYISPVPYEGAGARFRIYQYLPYLYKRGVKCSVSPFLFSSFFKVVYKKGNVISKILFFALSFLRRIFDLLCALNYDIIVIYRESFPFGAPFFEYILHFFRKRIIFDFDDAIFLPNSSEVNKMIARLRCFDNARNIIKMSKLVIAGNSYLRNYALEFNSNTRVIPSVIDTEKFRPMLKSNNKKIVIGWTGTNSTQQYLISLKGVLNRLLGKYRDIEIRIIGAQNDLLGLDKIVYKRWSLAEEVADIQDFSIGIMPLNDTDWAKGKCGFKIIQYMACGVPTVASNIGVNKEIVRDGVNGFLASSPDEWVTKISSLIDSYELRGRIGSAGREFIEEKYSLKEYEHIYYESIAGAIK